MRWVPGGALLAPVAIACGDGPERAPAAGQYAYSAAHPVPGSADSLRFAGLMVLTRTAGGLIAGEWDVPQLHPELRRGSWDGEAYVAYATPVHGGTLVHRIRRVGEPHELACSGHYSWMAANGDEQRVPLPCTLTHAPDAPPMGPMPPLQPLSERIPNDTTSAPATDPED